MTPEDRALIVRRLRQEADRIEAGGEPRECVARGEPIDCEDGEDVTGARRGALDALTRERGEASGSFWSDETTDIFWGVVVPIEEARLASRTCPSGTSDCADEVWDYDLFDAGSYQVEPPLDPCDNDDCWACHPWCVECGEPCSLLDDEGDLCPTCLDDAEEEP